MFERAQPPRDPVQFTLEGKTREAERGEPLAVSLLAAGEKRISRSPKLHRPRGPACLRGDCDGCLARVDEEPNVLTCLRVIRGGEKVESQNVLGSTDNDLLRLTDWFFPNGIDHHHLLAGVPGLHGVMQSFARKMAGIGRLPIKATPPQPGKRVSCDVLVVGAGISGLTVAARAAKAGLTVWLADDGHALGGAGRAAGEKARKIISTFDGTSVEVHLATTAIGIYRGETVLAGPSGAIVVHPRVTVIATGAHDGAIAVPNNDLPGVISARAIAIAASWGVIPAAPLALVGEGYWAERVKEIAKDKVQVELAEKDVESIRGGSRVKGITDQKGVTTKVSLVALAVPGAPAFELAEGAGAEVRLQGSGYAIVTDEQGRAAESVWATGECTGMPFEPTQLKASAEKVATAVVEALRA